MNNQITNLRPIDLPPEVTNLLEQFRGKMGNLKTVLKSFETLDIQEHPLAQDIHKNLRKAHDQIGDVLKAFQPTRFFVVVFGALKAGKSTLVNALVGKEVSPTGFGIETTVRGSIILPATKEEPEGMYIFTPRIPKPKGDEAEEKWNSDNCKALFDYLKGLCPATDFLKNFRKEKKILCEENLRHFLTDTVIPETPSLLPPVIRVNVGTNGNGIQPFLQDDHIGIIDSPGLDGIKAGDKDPFCRILPSNGDYFLFVQGSYAALNKCSKDYLEAVQKLISEGTPAMACAFNQFKAKFWLKQKVQDRELQEVCGRANKCLSEAIPDVSHPRSISINAAEAWDAIHRPTDMDGDPKEHFLESGIENLAQTLRDSISEDRVNIVVGNAKKKLKTILGEILHPEAGAEQVGLTRQIEDLNQYIQNRDEEVQKKKKTIEELIGTTRENLRNTGLKVLAQEFQSFLLDKFWEQIATNLEEAWENSDFGKVEWEESRISMNDYASKINDLRAAFNDKISNLLKNNSMIQFISGDKGALRSDCGAMSYCKDRAAGDLRNIQSNLDAILKEVSLDEPELSLPKVSFENWFRNSICQDNISNVLMYKESAEDMKLPKRTPGERVRDFSLWGSRDRRKASEEACKSRAKKFKDHVKANIKETIKKWDVMFVVKESVLCSFREFETAVWEKWSLPGDWAKEKGLLQNCVKELKGAQKNISEMEDVLANN